MQITSCKPALKDPISKALLHNQNLVLLITAQNPSSGKKEKKNR
jgi:hypothetical protein